MKQNCYMASVDLRDAYCSVPIDKEYQIFLRFSWKGKLFQFTCLPNGLSCAPRLFTKILKPVYATLRMKGHLNVGYIDDSYLQGDTAHQCQTNVSDTCCLFTRLGFNIHPVKSVLKPVQCLVFLGFVLKSINMTVCLPTEKVLRIKERCSKLLSNASISIQELAEVIGLLVSSFPGVIHGPLFYRNLETDKTMALRQNKGHFQPLVSLQQECLAELQWWCYNIDKAAYPICTPNSKIDVTLYTDASNNGWGAVMGTEKTGGRWTEAESNNHINCLELMAVLFRLKAFCSTMKSIHIRIYSDNTTTVSYINSMGGIHSMECNSVAKAIWLFCIERSIWISAAHVPGKKNIDADRESRVFHDNKEWMLRPNIFEQMTKIWGKPSIDLFASRTQTSTLKLPGRDYENHPLIKMILMACRLSGDPLKHKEFLKKLATSSFDHGDKELKSSTLPTSRGGLHSVIDNKLIVFFPHYIPSVRFFLVELFESGIGYSGMNTARSALSCLSFKSFNGFPFGSRPTVSRFLKGVFESRPTVPRYTETLDVGKVLSYLQTIPNSEDVSLKDLTLKTVMLVSLVSAQRGQTIHYLNLDDMISSETSITFMLKKPIKQSKPGVKPLVVKFSLYPVDLSICVVTTLRAYLARTIDKRGDNKQLFISFLKPFN